MNNEQLIKNFNACIDWCKSNADKVGNRDLYIPFGNYDGTARDSGFNSHHYRFSICTMNGKPIVLIGKSSAFVYEFYGYDDEYLSHRISNNHHSFKELPITSVETFLVNWRSIKSAIEQRIDEVGSLENFKV